MPKYIDADLISRQDAIDAIEKLDIPEDMCVFEILSHIELTIGTLPSAQQWIPCSERLPKEEKNKYWICTDTEYQCSCRWTNDNPFWNGKTSNWHWSIFDIPQYSKVVAWMSLPEPWKGEKNEQIH